MKKRLQHDCAHTDAPVQHVRERTDATNGKKKKEKKTGKERKPKPEAAIKKWIRNPS